MKIFGSISELVDLAFRLAGGKQVKLRAATQTTSGNLVTVNVPDVAATGDTQSMVLNAATQTLSNKTLSSPTVSGGTINNSIIGGSTPAAGTFTDIVGSTLDINTSAELQTLTIPSFSTAGILHNNSSGAVSSSLIVNADVDAAAAIAFSKLATLASGNILIGSSTGVPTSRTVTGDVTISDLGVTAIGASKVTDGMLAGNIDRSKLATGTNYRILANNASGVMSENAALTANEAVATDANGQLVSVTGVSATELGYLSGVTSDVQTQLNSKQASDATLSTIAALTPTTDQYIYFSGTDTATTGTITSFGRGLVDDADAATARSTLGLGSMATQAASSVAITGGTVRGVALDRLAVESDNAAIASGTLVPSKGLMIITAGDNTLNTLNPGVGFNLVNGAVLTVINNEGADITVTNAGNIQTGTGSDFTLKQGAASSFIWSTTLSKWVLSGGAGSSSATVAGFVNYITNADAQSDTTGWATYADAAGAAPVDGTGGTANVVWDRNTSSPLRGNADFAFAKDAANRQGQGVAFAFTLATTDRSKKCQISFDYDTSAANYAAGDLRVYIYDVTNAALITPQTVAIPKGTNTFQTTFDTTTSTSYRLILHVATTNATAYTVDFDNFVVNAGQVVQGAAIGDPVSVTMTTNLTNNTVTATETRSGSWAFYNVLISFTGAPSAGNLALNLPSGRTINTAALLSTDATSGNNLPHSSGTYRDAGTVSYPLTIAYNSTTSVALFYTDDAAAGVVVQNNITATTPTTIANTDYIKMSFAVPIAEWAGNGTVNLGPGAQVEYASGAITSDASTTTTIYGPAGSRPPTASLSTTRSATLTWQYPIQADDQIEIEISSDSGATWTPTTANGQGSLSYVIQNGVEYGVYLSHSSPTTTVVWFPVYARSTGSTYGGVGTAWSSLNSAIRYRVRKARASSPVGFSRASPATGFGLVAPRRGQQSLTVTATAGSWSTVRAVGIYYQDQDGNHRLKFNIVGTCTSSARTSNTLTVSGVTFKNVTTYLQAVSGFVDVAGGVVRAFANANASSIICDHSSLTTSLYSVSGDVELESAPTWA